MNQATKNSIKYPLYAYKRNRPEHAILLIANRRGGSTWLLEMLNMCLRTRFVDQQLSLFTLPVQLHGRFPIPEGGQFSCLSNQQLEYLARYLNSIVDGNVRVNEEWRLWRSSYWRHYDYTLLKVLHGMPIVKEVMDGVCAKYVIFLRSPYSQAMSVQLSGWKSLAPSFLSNQSYCERYLNRDSREFCEYVLTEYGDYERNILEWVLDKLPLFSHYEWVRARASFLSYEELVVRSEECLEKLVHQLDGVARLDKVDFKRPSRTTGISNKRGGDVDFNANKQLQKWRGQVDSKALNRAIEILKFFDLPFYDIESGMPSFSFLKNEY